MESNKLGQLFLDSYYSFFKKADKNECIKKYIDLASQKKFPEVVKCLHGFEFYRAHDYRKALNAFEQLTKEHPNLFLSWYGYGICLAEMSRAKEAEAALEQSLKIAPNSKYSFAEIGNIYTFGKDKQYAKAREYYNKALVIDPGYVTAKNGLAAIAAETTEYDKAIALLEEVLRIAPSFAGGYNNLGVIYHRMHRLNESRDFYLKAIECDPEDARYYNAIGNVYQELDEIENAKTYFIRALEIFRKEKNAYQESRLINTLKNLDEEIKSSKTLKEQIITRDTPIIIKVLKETLDKGIEKKAFEYKKSFENVVFEDIKIDTESPNQFEVLRRWNSYTPIIADNFHISKGGGYFIKINNNGIVIDPGFNFIDNFKGSKHNLKEINTILVSHAHNDHTADIESILTLIYKYNQKIKGLDNYSNPKTIRAELAEKNKVDISSITTAAIEEEFQKSSKRIVVDFYITNSVFRKYSGLFDLKSFNDYNIHIIEKGDTFNFDDINVKILNAKHHDIISDRDSVGFVIEYRNTVIVYSGDTSWSEEVEKQYRELAIELQTKYVVLVAHIGGFKEYENSYVEHQKLTESCYKNHLGRIGLVKINEILEPKVCFISEFGEELKLNHSREKIAEIYNSAFNKSILFFPADIGLRFDIDKRKILAVVDVDVDNKCIKYDYIEPCDVKTCELLKDYSIHYYDKTKTFSSDELTQLLGFLFDESIK